jgi:hypothetical protein
LLRSSLRQCRKWIQTHRQHSEIETKKVEFKLLMKNYRKIVWKAKNDSFLELVDKYAALPWGPVYKTLTKDASTHFMRATRSIDGCDNLDFDKNVENILTASTSH